MKIALIAPSKKFISEHEELNKLLTQELSQAYKCPEFNLTLLTLAALTPGDHDIRIFDEVYRDIPFEESFDIVAITAMSFNSSRAYEIAKKFKERGCHTVMGGIHATLLPEEVGEHVDSVFIGEAELTWPRFIEDFEKGRPEKKYMGNAPDLSFSPSPRWELIKDFLTEKALKKIRQYKLWTVSMNATRGCPRDCEYCSSTKVYGSKFRKKSIDQISNEIGLIKKWSKAYEVEPFTLAFRDDNPILSEDYAKKLLSLLKKEKIYWSALADISLYHRPELIKALYPSGCIALGLGFESLNVESLKGVAPWKSTQIKNYELFIQTAIREGLLLNINFILGMDHDSEESIQLIDEFCAKYPILPNFFFITPFPKQSFTQRLVNEGRLSLDSEIWDRCNLYNIVFEPKNISKAKLYERVSDLYRKYNNVSHLQSIHLELQTLRKKRGFASDTSLFSNFNYKPRMNQSYALSS